jgi:RNA polymerase sigma-70 factor, ECF subfamily
MSSSPADITRLLNDWSTGNQSAADQLTPLIYSELHKVARAYLRREANGHTLQATELLNETYLRLLGQNQDWKSRTQFLGVAAHLMRLVLVDHARRRKAGKRGPNLRTTLRDFHQPAVEKGADVLALDDALGALAKLDARKAQVIELHYFGGLEKEEIAAMVGISIATVGRELRAARAFLNREMLGPP